MQGVRVVFIRSLQKTNTNTWFGEWYKAAIGVAIFSSNAEARAAALASAFQHYAGFHVANMDGEIHRDWFDGRICAH